MNKNVITVVREKNLTDTETDKAYLYENAETIEMIIYPGGTVDIIYIRFTMGDDRYWVEKSTTDEKVWNTLVKLGGLENE